MPMDENQEATRLMPFAIAVARRMFNDPEADSIAGWALLRALRSFDSTKCSVEGYVAHCVKTDVKHYWRKLKVRRVVVLGGEDFDPGTVDSYTEDVLTPLEWKLLIEKYELRWPHDVVARRNNMSVSQVRRMLAAAVDKLQAIV